jgi:chemotaxis protein CheD
MTTIATPRTLNTLAVGLGEIKLSRDSQDVLVAYGLGSCVGIGLYDPVARVAGLLHAILPVNPSGMDAFSRNGGRDQSAKYVDSGVGLLIDMLTREGADRKRLVARMAGGANMLTAPGFSQTLNIGSRNVDTALSVLKAINLRLLGQETGGNSGRTVRFYITDGRMTIRSMGNQEREV